MLSTGIAISFGLFLVGKLIHSQKLQGAGLLLFLLFAIIFT